MMITATFASQEKCPYCIRGWLVTFTSSVKVTDPVTFGTNVTRIGNLVCEWCKGWGMVLVDRGYIGDEE